MGFGFAPASNVTKRGEVRVIGEREQRAGLLAEELEELGLRDAPRGRRVVVGDLEREAFGVRRVALFGARDDEDRADGAAAERRVHVEAADRASRR